MTSPPVTPMTNLEDVLARIGNANRFQVILVFFVIVPTTFVGWTMEEMTFVKAQPDWCCVPDHISQTPEDYCYHGNGTFGTECPDSGSNCTFRVFDDVMETMVNEWDLVCGRKYKTDLSISVQMAGVLVSSLVTGYLADFLGRKKTFFISISSLTIFSLVAGFSTSWEMFVVFRFSLGFSCGMYMVVSVPFMVEFLSPTYRQIPSTIPLFNLGGCLMTLVAWQIPNWRCVHWLCAAGTVPLLISWFFVPESLRWLTVKGKLDKAEDVIAYVARVNRRPVPAGCRHVLETIYELERRNAKYKGQQKTYGYLDIFRGRRFFKLSVLHQVIWFNVSFCSYGILFAASTLSINLYISLILVNLPSILMMLCLGVFMTRFGRRPVTICLTLGCTICVIASMVVLETVSNEDEVQTITTTLCLVASAFLATSWLALVIINNEAYPTVLRSLGFGAANSVARVGGILAPYAFDFKQMPILSYGLIGGLIGLSTVLVFFLDETLGLDMPDILQEIEKPLVVENDGNYEHTSLLSETNNEYYNKKDKEKYGAF